MLIASQIVGLCAVALYLLSYQLKKRSNIVWVTCISNALYVLQYIMLGAFSGAVMDFMSAVASFFAGKKNTPNFKKHSKWIAALNLLLIMVAGIIITVIRRDPIELIPIAGALLQTGGLWFENEQTIRKFGLCSAPFWLLYNFISQAYGAALGSLIAIISIIIAMIRYRKKTTEH